MAKLNGRQKAAVLMMAIGEEASAELLRNLSPEEIKEVGMQMSFMAGVKKDVYEGLLQEFSTQFYDQGDIHTEGDLYFRNLLSQSMENDEGTRVLSMIEREKARIPFKYMHGIDERVIAGTLKVEHPQTIALILVHLGQQKASFILAHLPEALRLEVLRRIAHLETVPEDLVREVDEVLQDELAAVAGKGVHQILGGVRVAAGILNNCDRRTGDAILEAMEEQDVDLADEIRKFMFVFEDLAMVDDIGIRELLKETANEDLLLALKTASEDLKTKIFKNLSQRAAQMIEEDMAVMGPARLSDVEAAQQKILQAARKLEREGKIVLSNQEGGDALV